MADIYIKENSYSIEKPFTLTKRIADMAETNYYDICLLSIENAKLLIEHGLNWRWREEPDWEKLYNRIAVMRLEKEKKDVQDRIDKILYVPF